MVGGRVAEFTRGFAAAQCGQASPDQLLSNFPARLGLAIKGAQPLCFWNLLMVRQSLTALCGGRAAN